MSNKKAALLAGMLAATMAEQEIIFWQCKILIVYLYL